jgi:hypothetical protein
VITRRPLDRDTGRVLLNAVAAFGACIVVFGLSRSFPLSLAMLGLSGFFDLFSMQIRLTMSALITPERLRGRVGAVEMVFISASNELGVFESGLAASLVGAIPAVVGGGALTIMIAIGWRWAFPALARVDRLQDLAPSRLPLRDSSGHATASGRGCSVAKRITRWAAAVDKKDRPDRGSRHAGEIGGAHLGSVVKTAGRRCSVTRGTSRPSRVRTLSGPVAAREVHKPCADSYPGQEGREPPPGLGSLKHSEHVCGHRPVDERGRPGRAGGVAVAPGVLLGFALGDLLADKPGGLSGWLGRPPGSAVACDFRGALGSGLRRGRLARNAHGHRLGWILPRGWPAPTLGDRRRRSI